MKGKNDYDPGEYEQHQLISISLLLPSGDMKRGRSKKEKQKWVKKGNISKAFL